jgi:hypothetical protein
VSPQQHTDGLCSSRSELDIMRQLAIKKSPYLVELYGALVYSVRQDHFSSFLLYQLCIHLIFQKKSELYLCMELMDITLKKFYETMHQPGSDTRSQWDPLIWRLIHDVRLPTTCFRYVNSTI